MNGAEDDDGTACRRCERLETGGGVAEESCDSILPYPEKSRVGGGELDIGRGSVEPRRARSGSGVLVEAADGAVLYFEKSGICDDGSVTGLSKGCNSATWYHSSTTSTSVGGLGVCTAINEQS